MGPLRGAVPSVVCGQPGPISTKHRSVGSAHVGTLIGDWADFPSKTSSRWLQDSSSQSPSNPRLRGPRPRLLINAETTLHFLEGKAFALRVEEEDDKKLQGHHGGKKYEGVSAGRLRQQRKDAGNQSVHDPVRRASQALPFGSHAITKNFPH